MGGWNENNLSAILEYPFDYRRYIEERLREIDDPDERRFAKELLLNGLWKVIQATEQKYEKLEQSVYEELEIKDNEYEIAITIVSKNEYNRDNRMFYPIIPEDLNEVGPKKEQPITNGIYLGTVFLELDDNEIIKCQKASPFYGTILCKEREIPMPFKIQPASRYRHRIETLYQVFEDNHIPWNTVHTGYLDKFFDVFMDVSLEKSRDDFSTDTLTLKESSIWFGRFTDSIKFDVIPVWNIEILLFKCKNFMTPCADGKYYEHEFPMVAEEGGYLIQFNEDIKEVWHEKNKIIIKSQKETFEDWKAFHIIQNPRIQSLKNHKPLLTNHIQDSFIRRVSEHNKVHLMTKADLFRRIMELDIQEYLEITGYEIHENTKDYPYMESMNWFIKDELFPMESRKVLLLQFTEKQPGHHLNGSMVRFVISQIQLQISEYRLIGVIL